MDEYIKREDALKALQSVRDCLADSILKHRHIPDFQKEVFEAIISAAERVINRTHTADVAPKSEVERLEKDVLIWKQDRFNLYQRLELYDLARQKVAREIFEEIEAMIERYINISWYTMEDVKKYLAELKKKYTEGE